uniref:Putative ovule protein n=1 Tax=Solanum chacoense TaxID=4108 RepID=A0A0V0GER7_SOLCH
MKCGFVGRRMRKMRRIVKRIRVTNAIKAVIRRRWRLCRSSSMWWPQSFSVMMVVDGGGVIFWLFERVEVERVFV